MTSDIVIVKFGGKLLENAERIHKAAEYIIKVKERGEFPVAVVSAPGKTTDLFLEKVNEITTDPTERELDMLLSVGERTAMALLAMAINKSKTCHAVSFTGSQVGIITDTKHTNAQIIEVKCFRIREAIAEGYIPIIAGFQGVSVEKEITTLGRGGSDATAVALAAALNAKRCELVKEHGGIYTADPEVVSDAVKHESIDCDTVENLTSAGAKVVQPRAIALAREHDINIAITDNKGAAGTKITDKVKLPGAVSSIALEQNLSCVSIDSPTPLEGSYEFRMLFRNRSESIAIVKLQNNVENFKPVDIVSVIGWGGALNNEIVNSLLSLEFEADSGVAYVFMQFGALVFVLNAEKGADLLKYLHNYCIIKGFILKESNA